MRLLIITQRVDRRDPILGFFHRWIDAFASRLTTLTVIGQQVGERQFPAHVTVHSLGKELGSSRFRQIVRFWKIIFQERSRYDAVFVHMTPIWVVLGWPIWRLLHRPVYLWYEARGGGIALPLSLRVATKIFGASDYGLPRRSFRHVIVGHGIDTEWLSPDPSSRVSGSLVAVGRVTPVKHYDVLLRTLHDLPQHCTLHIAGGAFTQSDQTEYDRLVHLMQQIGIKTRVTIGWVAPDAMRELLQKADCMLHACTGGLDKCVLEAMACGCPVVSTSEAARRVLPALCCVRIEDMATRVRQILDMPMQERDELSRELRQRVVNGHSLVHLIERLLQEMRV